nr:hypothetical protein [Tanacetum cinerariifolium]
MASPLDPTGSGPSQSAAVVVLVVVGGSTSTTITPQVSVVVGRIWWWWELRWGLGGDGDPWFGFDGCGELRWGFGGGDVVVEKRWVFRVKPVLLHFLRKESQYEMGSWMS